MPSPAPPAQPTMQFLCVPDGVRCCGGTRSAVPRHTACRTGRDPLHEERRARRAAPLWHTGASSLGPPRLADLMPFTPDAGSETRRLPHLWWAQRRSPHPLVGVWTLWYGSSRARRRWHARWRRSAGVARERAGSAQGRAEARHGSGSCRRAHQRDPGVLSPGGAGGHGSRCRGVPRPRSAAGVVLSDTVGKSRAVCMNSCPRGGPADPARVRPTAPGKTLSSAHAHSVSSSQVESGTTWWGTQHR
jgi:hypothetical protein